VSRTVLVAEDEANIVESLRFLMIRAGLEVRIATDGPSALRMVRESPPDLMLLDIMLPGCDGFVVLRAIRANPQHGRVRVMMLTAKGREIDRARALELGVDDFVTKPFSTRDVMARVRGLVGLAVG
jgi:two-component system alkaline phosphatase synthesis response regulator PhoP